MLRRSAVALASLVSVLMFQQPSWSTDCPGFCTQCRSDSIFVCGSGCVASYSCSLSTCTCSFSCRTSGGCPHSPQGVSFHDRLDPKVEFALWMNAHAPSNIHFDVSRQVDVPLTVTDLSVRNDPGRQTSQLIYTVRNESDSTLQEIQLMLVFFNDRNEPLGGEYLSESLSLGAQQEYQFQASLHHYVDDGQRVAIRFVRFRTDTQSWHGNHAEIISSIKQRS